jgi:hypothetical protein
VGVHIRTDPHIDVEVAPRPDTQPGTVTEPGTVTRPYPHAVASPVCRREPKQVAGATGGATVCRAGPRGGDRL